MIQRCLILIDGSNFYFKLKDLKINNLLRFDFNAFAGYLARSGKIVGRRYYVGRIRQDGTERTDKMLANQQKLLAALRSHKFSYTLGYLLRSDGVLHEKGVDVQIAVDMLVAAYENKCDRIILVSSDTDLAPAIEKAQGKNKIVEYIGFAHKPSVAMVRFCKRSRLLAIEDILPYVAKN